MWVLLVTLLSVSGAGLDAFAQNRLAGQPVISGYPPIELLASDIPLYSDGCCGRLDVRAQFVAKDADLIWAEGSDTPIKRMSKNSGEITTIATWTGSPLNAVVRGPFIYWIEDRYHPNTGQPLPRLNRTVLDGTLTTTLDEGPRSPYEFGTTDILVTDSDAFWVSAIDTTVCNEFSCTSGHIKWSIRKVPLSGGSPTTVVITAVDNVIVSMAMDLTHLYGEENGVYSGSSRIKKIPLAGGEVSDVVDGSLNGIVEDWEPTGGIAVGGSELFFANSRSGLGRGLMKVSVSGGPVTILSGDYDYETAPRKLAVDATNLYWVDRAALKSIARNGGAIRELASGLGLPMDLVIGESNVFWAENYCCGRNFTGNIKMISTSGGAAITLVSELDGVRSLDVASPTLYFIEGSWPSRHVASGRIAKAPTTGQPVTTIATAVMADAGTPMAVDDNNVYFADASGLKKVSLQGGVVERLASELLTDAIYALAADGQFVYWLSGRRNPVVRKIPVEGGAIEDVMLRGDLSRHSSARLVLSNGYFYWIERSYGESAADAVMKASIHGGHAVAIASGRPPLGDIAVAGDHVYFVEAGYPNKVQRISTDGGPITTVGAADDGSVLAADDSGAYWVNLFYLVTVPPSGGNQRWLAANPGGVALALDANAIYWLDFEGSIFKIDRSKIDGFINMVFPRPGDVWTIRSRRIIQWWYAGIGSRVTVSLSRDGGLSWTTLARNKPNSGALTWRVTKPATTQAIIRVCSVTVPTLCDTSETFMIQ